MSWTRDTAWSRRRSRTGRWRASTASGGRSARRKRLTAPTEDGLGLVVQAETYRPPSVTGEALRRRLWGDDEDLLRVVEEGRQALRDGFPGTTLRLGKGLWATGALGQRGVYAVELMDAAYAALGRETLRRVLREHWAHRDRPWLDVLHPEDTNGAH